jgi:tRNA (guanosine-2'-O-)-methyltransferase
MTPRRFDRLRGALERRQPDLTVIMENVHKPHNLAAVMRTSDAVGILEVHAVPGSGEDRAVEAVRPARDVSQGTERWVKLLRHESLRSVADTMRKIGFSIIAAHPSPDARDFREVDYCRPIALLLGQEKEGLSREGLAISDQHVAIPMKGLVASLNVSVAAALILFEAQRQRDEAGMYDECRLEPERFDRTLFEWAYPRLSRIFRKQGRPYPRIGEDGQIVKIGEQ